MAQSTTEHISADVESIIAPTGKTLPDLSQETGISQARLSRIIRHLGQATIDELAALTRAIPLDISTIEVR